jgi:hypothetical protein
MLESACEHPLPCRHLNETDLSLSEQQKLTYVRYNMRLRPPGRTCQCARETPTFGPVLLVVPPMVLDPIDSEAADDFDEGSG